MNLYSIEVADSMLPAFLRGSHRLGGPARPAATACGAGGRFGMSGTYGEPVQVKARPDGRPMRFVWRSRLYTVRAIWEHWVINREWWREPADSGDAGTEPGQPELIFWRVEAAPGRGMTPGVYELRQDVATAAWTIRLSR
ncbi:MAG: DUF6504 family protein [Streptosporangiaceae bacterium]